MGRSSDSRSGDAERARRAGGVPEHRCVPGAEILDVDTWADEGERCPSCGAETEESAVMCPRCGQWLERCSGSCPSCASPRCVGGRRGTR